MHAARRFLAGLQNAFVNQGLRQSGWQDHESVRLRPLVDDYLAGGGASGNAGSGGLQPTLRSNIEFHRVTDRPITTHDEPPGVDLRIDRYQRDLERDPKVIPALNFRLV